MTCLIVGAGMAGLTAAGALSAAGWRVVLLDKGRGAGGRMATRRMGTRRLDHGAQFFTARTPEFRAAVEQWEQAGWVQPWFAESGHARYRSADGMSGLARHLAEEGYELHLSTKVETLTWEEPAWVVRTEGGGSFAGEAVVLTPPAAQTLALLESSTLPWPPEWKPILDAMDYDPCFALLITGSGESRVPAPGYVRPAGGPIAWVADNRQKGITAGDGFCLTVHADAAFSRRHFDTPAADVIALLREAASPWFSGEVEEQQLHRWKFSQPVATYPEACLFTPHPAPLALAGDIFGGPRVEGAFLSGRAAAQRILGG